MKIIFINPSVKDSKYRLLSSIQFCSVPMGIGYLAGYLRNKFEDVDIKIIDEAITPLSYSIISKTLESLDEPIIVGISCLTSTFSRAIELARHIKFVKHNSLVIFGGIHPTALPGESLMTGSVDIVVRNEGEVTMADVYEAFTKKEPFSEIKGISYIENGKIYHNQDREYLKLNILPDFPYDLFERIQCYSDLGMILASRGCQFGCVFCCNNLTTGKTYRPFGVDYVIRQIETLIMKYNQKSIVFCDENFISDKEHFFKLTQAIFYRGLHKKVFFCAQVRAADINEEVLDCMKKANFKVLFCGIETSSDRLLTLLNREETLSQIIRGIKLADSMGFLVSTNFIFGVPSETKVDRFNSLRFSSSLPLDVVRFNIAVPYPGTKLYELAKEEGSLRVSSEWGNFHLQHYLFGDDIPYLFDPETKYSLLFDTMWANIRFNLRRRTLKMFFNGNLKISLVALRTRKDCSLFCLRLFKISVHVCKRFTYLWFSALVEEIKNNLFLIRRAMRSCDKQ